MKCFNFLTQTCYSWLIADSSLDVFPTNGVNLSPGTETVQLVAHIMWEVGGLGGGVLCGEKIFQCNFNLFVHLRLTCGPHQDTDPEGEGEGKGEGHQ